MTAVYIVGKEESRDRMNDLGYTSFTLEQAKEENLWSLDAHLMLDKDDSPDPFEEFSKLDKGLFSLRVSKMKESFLDMSDDGIDAWVTKLTASKPKWLRDPELIEFGAAMFDVEDDAPREWIMSFKRDDKEVGFIPAGELMATGGRGGLGKSTWAIGLGFALAVATFKGESVRFMDMDVHPKGASVIFTYEETFETAKGLIKDLAKSFGVTLQDVNDLFIVVMMGKFADGSPLGIADRSGNITPSDKYFSFSKKLVDYRRYLARHHKTGIGYIVVDNVGSAYDVDGNSYNTSNSSIRLADRWCVEHKACVNLIAHTKKIDHTKIDDNSDLEMQQTIMGSAGWVTRIRLLILLWDMDYSQEVESANLLKDEEFIEGETHTRYLKMAAVKSNIRGYYSGRIIARRDWPTLTNVSGELAKKKKGQWDILAKKLSIDIVNLAANGETFTKSGRGTSVFDNKNKFNKPFNSMPKDKLNFVIDFGLEKGWLTTTKDPENPRRSGILCGQAGFDELVSDVLRDNLKRMNDAGIFPTVSEWVDSREKLEGAKGIVELLQDAGEMKARVEMAVAMDKTVFRKPDNTLEYRRK